MTAFLEGLLIAVAATFLTVIVAWVATRVSRKDCITSQKLCQEGFQNKICAQGLRLDDGDDTFKSTRHIQRAVLLTLLFMCKKLDIDCDELTRTFVKEDILE
jgi:hypothetical protein